MDQSSSHIETLRFGPVSPTAVHLCIDMQLMFSEATKWASPAVGQVLPAIMEICSYAAQRTIFTRFLTPPNLSAARRHWCHFYEESSSMLAENIKTEQLEIVPALRRFVPPARMVSRYVFSAFASPVLEETLDLLRADTLLLSGIESDVCVLATALGAIDRGFRLIIVKDAIASSKFAGHEAVTKGIYPRFDQQVEMITAERALSLWNPVPP
jgi:nicotinamidase-related amidase